MSNVGYTGQVQAGSVPVWRHDTHWCLTSPHERGQGASCDFIFTPAVIERIITCKEQKQ